MIKFACPGCAAVFSVGDEKAGKTGKCPKCSAQFQIPDAEAPADGAAPSVPPPLTEDPGVEIKPCPGCQAKLTVSPGDIGLDVECPYCKTVYKAKKLGGTAAIATTDDRPSRRPRDDDKEERPKRRSRRDDDEDDDDRPSKRRDRYDDDDERPSRRRRRKSYEPHRGGLILTLGILGFFVCGPILGPMAWVMGSNDLKQIEAGRMDPEGHGLTQAGRIMGMIVSILWVLAILFYCVIFAFAIVGGAAGGGGR